MTVSAAVRLIPSPPALVLSKKILHSGSELKASIWDWRSSDLTEPSIRKQGQECRMLAQSWRISSCLENWEKMMILWPEESSGGIRRSRRDILPEAVIRVESISQSVDQGQEKRCGVLQARRSCMTVFCSFL